MKFINYLTSIDGIGIFPMISLMIFFVFFIGLLVYTFRMSKKDISHLESLPFEDEQHH
jgi:cytochrome c oxidase cbb3-type subunit III